ncbi:MAG: hypothetical protein ABI673_00795 [Novosphingobium sp.]
MMRNLALFAAAALVCAPQIAAAAEPACLTPREVTAFTAFALPGVITATAQRCSAVLPAGAFLRTSGQQMAQRYAARKSAVWPETKAALIKLSGGSNDQAANLFKTLPDETLQQLADTMVTGVVADKIPASRCGVIDQFLALLSPLPPENTAELIGLTMGLVSRGETPKLGKLSICKA